MFFCLLHLLDVVCSWSPVVRVQEPAANGPEQSGSAGRLEHRLRLRPIRRLDRRPPPRRAEGCAQYVLFVTSSALSFLWRSFSVAHILFHYIPFRTIIGSSTWNFLVLSDQNLARNDPMRWADLLLYSNFSNQTSIWLNDFMIKDF